MLECFAYVFLKEFYSFCLFRSLIRFEFLFVYDVRKCSSFILSEVVDKFSQHHLLERLSIVYFVLAGLVTESAGYCEGTESHHNIVNEVHLRKMVLAED